MTEVSRNISAADNEFSSSILSCINDQSGESLTMLKNSTWCHLFKEVGHILEDGVVEFRKKLSNVLS